MRDAGSAISIDSVARGGTREEDLALLASFGAIHFDEILRGYGPAHLLSDLAESCESHQLYVVLAYAVLFGGEYAEQAAAMAAKCVRQLALEASSTLATSSSSASPQRIALVLTLVAGSFALGILPLVSSIAIGMDTLIHPARPYSDNRGVYWICPPKFSYGASAEKCPIHGGLDASIGVITASTS